MAPEREGRGSHGLFKAGNRVAVGRREPKAKPELNYREIYQEVRDDLLARPEEGLSRLKIALDELYEKDKKSYLKLCVDLLPRPSTSQADQAKPLTLRDIVAALESPAVAPPPVPKPPKRARARPPKAGDAVSSAPRRDAEQTEVTPGTGASPAGAGVPRGECTVKMGNESIDCPICDGPEERKA